MATSKKTEVAVAQENAVAFSQEVPDYINQGAARGSEEVKSSDMVLPRLEIVQALSPIKDEIEDIKEGQLFNSVTREVFGDVAYFVPVYYKMEYLVWKDQDKGGGFFGSFASESEAKTRIDAAVEAGESRDDLEIVDTPVQYGLRVEPGSDRTEQIVISMAKTKAKVSRKWNAMIQIAGGDRFSRVYKLSTFKDENSKGQKFHNFVVQNAGFTPKAAYLAAERLYEILKTQDFRVAHDSVVENEGSESSGSTDRGNI